VHAEAYDGGYATDAKVARKLVGVCDVLLRAWCVGTVSSGLASKAIGWGWLRAAASGAGQVFSKIMSQGGLTRRPIGSSIRLEIMIPSLNS
jgi:hypothetical protein